MAVLVAFTASVRWGDDEMKHKAKVVLGERTICGEYAFVEGYHVIYENFDRNNPVIIRLSTLEEVRESHEESNQ